jgi:hypothetical protein
MRSLGLLPGTAMLLAALPHVAATQAYPADAEGWTGIGPEARVVRIDGRAAFSMHSGRVFRRDVKLLDGTIDVDVRLTRARSFVYVQFRMESDSDHEEFYLRPHKSDLPDALQYAPVFRGQSAWQLFHGPGGTAPVKFEAGQWTHLRIVLSGRRAALFVGDTTQPALVVSRLAREPRAGYLALRSFLPAGVAATEDPAVFANLVVRPGVLAYDFSTRQESAPPAGLVLRWEIGDAFQTPAERAALPSGLAATAWRAVDAEPNGTLMLGRYLEAPAGARSWSAAVRLRLRSDRAQTVPLELGYSDAVTAFLNGLPLFSGDARYSYDNPRQEGVIGLWQATVYLPLRAGSNELVFVVSDAFGGWGLMGRLAPGSPVTIESRTP